MQRNSCCMQQQQQLSFNITFTLSLVFRSLAGLWPGASSFFLSSLSRSLSLSLSLSLSFSPPVFLQCIFFSFPARPLERGNATTTAAAVLRGQEAAAAARAENLSVYYIYTHTCIYIGTCVCIVKRGWRAPRSLPCTIAQMCKYGFCLYEREIVM